MEKKIKKEKKLLDDFFISIKFLGRMSFYLTSKASFYYLPFKNLYILQFFLIYT